MVFHQIGAMVEDKEISVGKQFRCFIAGLFLMSFMPGLNAQDHFIPEQFTGRWEVGIHGGTSLFFGDIKEKLIFPISKHVNEWRWAGGVNVGYQISPVFKVLLQGIYGTLSGTRRSWNVYFEAEYFETNMVMNVNFINLFSKKRFQHRVSVYGVLGIGIMQHNTEIKDLETSEVITRVGYGSGGGINGMTVEGVATYGFGMGFIITDNWSIQLESVNRAINTDYLDGYKNQYPYDVYNYTSVGVIYRFDLSNIQKERKKRRIKKIDVHSFTK